MSLAIPSAFNHGIAAQIQNITESITSGLGSVQNPLKEFDFFRQAIQSDVKNDTTCEVTAWLQPNHGFVQFNCQEIQGIIGMYPQDPTEDGVQDFSHPTFFAFGTNIASSGSNSMGITLLSSADAMAFTFAARINEAARGLFENPFAFFKYKSFLGGIHSVNSAATENLSSIKLKYWGDRYPAVIKDDTRALSFCQHESCKFAKVQVSKNKASEMYGYAKKKPHSYQLFGGNCVDYLTRVMDQSKKDWKRNFEYTRPPTFPERLLGLAWQYLNWQMQA